MVHSLLRDPIGVHDMWGIQELSCQRFVLEEGVITRFHCHKSSGCTTSRKATN